MSIRIRELVSFFDERIPRSLSCEWDNDGVMVCVDKEVPVRRIMFTLDVTVGALEYADEHGCDTVISHHPLIFRPISSISPENVSSAAAIYAVKHGINVLSYHTRLDALPVYGVNDTLADLFGLCECMPFGPEGEVIGRIGTLKKRISLKECCKEIKQKLSSGALIVTDSGREVERIAVLGGDGKDFLKSAVLSGADTFVTGRCSYNADVDAETYGINVVEAGHFNTEYPVLASVEKLISSQFAGFEFVYYKHDATKAV